MKLCIYGAGAIGGYLASQLGNAGYEVSCIARGAHLGAMRQNGLRVLVDGKDVVTYPRCTEDPSTLAPQDYVFITTKAHGVPPVAENIAPLLGPDTAVVTAHNGLPWWYFYKSGGSLENKTLANVDPGSKIWKRIGPDRAIGCVVYPAAEVESPGVVRHIGRNKFTLGEPDGCDTDRIWRLSETMATAGLDAPIDSKIREEIWLKLAANVSVNPTGALIGGTMGNVLNDKDMQKVAHQIITECHAIAIALGITIPVTPDQLIDSMRQLGDHKTSMAQDFEAGRKLEIDALVGATCELAQLTNTPAPTIEHVLAIAKLKAKLAGL